jgi:hypothetical protein
MPLAHSGEQRGQFVIVSDAPVRLQIQQAHGRQWVGEFTPRGDDAEVDYPRAAGRHEAGFEPFPPPRAIPVHPLGPLVYTGSHQEIKIEILDMMSMKSGPT